MSNILPEIVGNFWHKKRVVKTLEKPGLEPSTEGEIP